MNEDSGRRLKRARHSNSAAQPFDQEALSQPKEHIFIADSVVGTKKSGKKVRSIPRFVLQLIVSRRRCRVVNVVGAYPCRVFSSSTDI